MNIPCHRRLAAAACLLLTLVALADAQAQSKTIFVGTPQVKVSEAGVARVADEVPPAKASSLLCVIVFSGNKYYWASRDNKEMARNWSGAYITYTAIDGSGYVRTVAPGSKRDVSALSETGARFDYVEHLMLGLQTLTYFGVER